MPDSPRPLPPKKEVALALLETSSLYVHLDPRREGVVVPTGFLRQPQLVLQIGLNMAVRIPDLNVEDDAITCTLSFNRTPCWCYLPWTAVYALVSEDGSKGMVWPDDVPPELALQAQGKPGDAKPPAKKGRPKLASVGGTSKSSPRGGAKTAKPAREDAPGKGGTVTALPRRQTPQEDAFSDGNAARPRTFPEAAETDDESESAPPSPPKKKTTTKAQPGEKKPKRELPPYLRVVK